MRYRIGLILLASIGPGAAAGAADPSLPAGAAMRLGELRFRAGAEVAELHFSPDGTELTSRSYLGADRMRTTLWDVAGGLPLAATTENRRAGSRVRWSAASIPDSSRGIVIGDDGVPVVRDFRLEKDVARLTGHFARVTAVAVSPDGQRIATASADGLIRLWNAATFQPSHEPVGHTAAVRTLELAPDGRTLLTTGGDRTVRLWDLTTGRQRRAFAIPSDSQPVFAADGAAIRIPTPAGECVRDLVTGLEITSPVPRTVDPLAFVKLAMGYSSITVAIAPDGRTVAVGRGDGSIELWEVAACGVRRTLPGHGSACRDLVFTTDSSRLLSAGSDHTVLVWPVRIRDVPLTAELRRETDASKLWSRMAYGAANESYAAMARLAADPAAAVTMARFCMKPGSVANPIADGRAIELLEAIGSPAARSVLRKLAEDDSDHLRIRMVRAALQRLGDANESRDGIRTIGGTRP